MLRDPESYKAYIRDLVGETYWSSPPAVTRFQQEYMSREGALAFALEHCHFTDRFPRWFGSIVANCPHIDARAYMIANMFVEEVEDPTMPIGHNESMWAFARALGATREQIANYVPLITTTMALHYYDDISRTRPWLEAFAGVALLEMITNAALAAKHGHIPPNSKKPWAALDLDGEAMSHWVAAERADHGAGDSGPGHGEEALAVLATYATTAELQERCAGAVREALLVNKCQYDAIGRVAIEATKRARAAAV